MSGDADLATSLDNLVQHLKTLPVKKYFLIPQPLLMQLEVISSHLLSCYLCQETSNDLAIPSFKIAVESFKLSPEPPFL